MSDGPSGVICAECGVSSPAGAQFCGGCGRPFEVRRHRRWQVWLGLVVLAAGVAAGGLWVGSRTGTGEGDRLEVAAAVGAPEDVVFPQSVDDDAAVAFLEGEGAPLVEFVRLTSAMFTIDTSNVGACERLAADLDDVASPPLLMELAGRVPDRVTSELFVDDLAAKLRLLGVCGTSGGDVGATVAFQSELLERRLSELGVSW